MRCISIGLEQGTTNVEFIFTLAQETNDGDLQGEVQYWTQLLDEVNSWSELMEKLTDSFLSSVEYVPTE